MNLVNVYINSIQSDLIQHNVVNNSEYKYFIKSTQLYRYTHQYKHFKGIAKYKAYDSGTNNISTFIYVRSSIPVILLRLRT